MITRFAIALPAVAAFFTAVSSAIEVGPLREDVAAEYGLDPAFFKKTTEVEDILIATSDRVSDFAHVESAWLFERMMENLRPDVARRIRERKVLCIIAAHDELTSEIPQFGTDKTGRELAFYNWRQRGFLRNVDGRMVVFFAEEDVMEYEGGMRLESILVHEFGHVIDFAGLDEELRERLTSTYQQAQEKGLWNDGLAALRFRRVTGDEPVVLLDALVRAFPDRSPDLLRRCLDAGDILVNGEPTHVDVKVTGADQVLIVFGGEKGCYAILNRAEYFAEGVQAWFDTNRTMDHDHNHIHTRDQLKEYDPALAAFLAEVLGDADWRFTSPRDRAGRDHLAGYDPASAPVVENPDFIREAALDYYDGYWSSYWVRLEEKHATAEAAAAPAWLNFRVQELHQDRNEGIAVADYNGDGHPDISAGEFWYQGPDFTEKRPVRKLAPFSGGEWLTNNGEHAIDLNLDGHPDILTGSFMESELVWYENPGPEGLREGRMWQRHVLIDTGLKQNEATLMADIDGDGSLDLLVNHWQDGHPMRYYKITPAAGGPEVKMVTVAEAGQKANGHGVGVGDLNGSGRNDIIYKNGWYEQLADGSWQHHAAWAKPFMSLPALVVDVNGSGRADILWGNGHDYGLYWEEQLEPAASGELRWKQHVIDDTWSQAHVLVWHDLDGDGRPELITGKRYYGHGGGDPGADDGIVLYAYKWRAETGGFERHPIVISDPASKQGPGVGLQVRVADLNGNGRPDITAAGKSGTYIIWNEGPAR